MSALHQPCRAAHTSTCRVHNDAIARQYTLCAQQISIATSLAITPSGTGAFIDAGEVEAQAARASGDQKQCLGL